MSTGRRNVVVDDPSAWVFNRMVDAYAARPAYPAALLDAIAELAPPAGRIADIGAGIGHLALPLAERGFEVMAIEPARAMLDRLRSAARERGQEISALHGAAEALPLASDSIDLAIVADALHFIDVERAAPEFARVIRRRGALAVISCEFSDTPFMRSLSRIMEEAAPRRPRAIAGTTAQLFSIVGAALQPARMFSDQTAVEPALLEQLLRSISFIGPAMNASRFAAFRARVHALHEDPVWARSFALHAGHRR